MIKEILFAICITGGFLGAIAGFATIKNPNIPGSILLGFGLVGMSSLFVYNVCWRNSRTN